MKQKIKEKWLEALRSGKYSQTKKTLKNAEGFCCLGVLCDIHRKTMKKKEYNWYLNKNEIQYLEQVAGVPKKVRKWAGLDKNCDLGQYTQKNGKGRALAYINDEGKSFKQIANIIEKYF